jgi:hypothetical protein
LSRECLPPGFFVPGLNNPRLNDPSRPVTLVEELDNLLDALILSIDCDLADHDDEGSHALAACQLLHQRLGQGAVDLDHAGEQQLVDEVIAIAQAGDNTEFCRIEFQTKSSDAMNVFAIAPRISCGRRAQGRRAGHTAPVVPRFDWDE